MREKAAKADTLSSQKSELEGKITLLNSKLDGLVKKFTDTMAEVVKVVGQKTNVPAPEETKTAEDAVNVMTAWFQSVAESLVKQVEEVDGLKEKLDEIKKEARASEIKGLLSGIVSDENIAKFVENANGMEDAWKEPCQEFSLEQLLDLFESPAEASPSSS